jgi:hypothetical protein
VPDDQNGVPRPTPAIKANTPWPKRSKPRSAVRSSSACYDPLSITGAGTVANAAGGAIIGIGYGVYFNGGGAITNSSSIAGLTLGGVFVEGAASVTNRVGGVVSSYTEGVEPMADPGICLECRAVTCYR